MRAVRYGVILWLLLAAAVVVWPLEAIGAGNAVPIRSDLNGDNESDTAFGKISGSTLRIKIHLSGVPSPILLSTVVRYEPGLTLVAYDVDNDHKVDLVLRSIFSVRPVAVWLNRSHGKFKKASGWIAAFPIHNDGPQFHRRVLVFSEHGVMSYADPLPVLSDTTSAGSVLRENGRAIPDHNLVLLTRCFTNYPERAPPLS